MERKILFKAKRLDNGEWVKGDLQHSASLTKSVQVYKTIIATPIKSNHGEILGHSLYEVAPSTVCQFTGLKDKNGVEIWEGDYLSSIYGRPKQKKVKFKNGAFGIDTYYRGLDFLPLACCDIRAGCLVEFELEDRKEGEK